MRRRVGRRRMGKRRKKVGEKIRRRRMRWRKRRNMDWTGQSMEQNKEEREENGEGG